MNKAFRALRVCLALLLCAALLSGCGSRSWRKGGVPGSKPYVRGKTYYPLKSAHCGSGTALPGTGRAFTAKKPLTASATISTP